MTNYYHSIIFQCGDSVHKARRTGHGSVGVTNGYGVIPPAVLALIELPRDILLQVDIHCARGVAYGPKINMQKNVGNKFCLFLLACSLVKTTNVITVKCSNSFAK